MLVKTSDYLKKVSKLFRALALTYQIGFVQGLSHLSEKQVLRIKQAPSCDDPERVINEYDQRMRSLIGSGFGISFTADRMAFRTQ